MTGPAAEPAAEPVDWTALLAQDVREAHARMVAQQQAEALGRARRVFGSDDPMGLL